LGPGLKSQSNPIKCGLIRITLLGTGHISDIDIGTLIEVVVLYWLLNEANVKGRITQIYLINVIVIIVLG